MASTPPSAPILTEKVYDPIKVEEGKKIAPHHVTNRSALTSGHTAWESYADSNRTNYVKLYGTRYNLYGTNYSSYAQASANYAAGWIDEAEATYGDGSPDYTKWDQAAENTYEFCEDTLAAVIDAFFRSEGVNN